MARPLLVPNPENATIEELKQVSRIGSIETATRCTAIQMLLAGANTDLVCNALFVTNRANLADDQSTLVQQRCLQK